MITFVRREIITKRIGTMVVMKSEAEEMKSAMKINE